MQIKWLAIGIVVGYLTPYLLEYLKNKQNSAPAQETSQSSSNVN